MHFSGLKLSVLISFIFSFLIVHIASAQHWQSANGNITSADLNEVQLVTDQIAYAIGNTGTILKSTDGGATWTDVSYGDSRNYQGLFFFDAESGFVGGPFTTAGGGSSEMLAKTEDGGQTWDIRSSFNFNNFNDIEFLDPQNGWVASADGEILFTSDGGESWSSVTAGTEDLLDFHIVNDTTFWVAGESGSLYKSIDAGSTWESAIQIDTVSYSGFQNLSSSDDLYNIAFTDDQTGYVIGETYNSGFVGFILKTTDGGTSWSVIDYEFEHLFYDIELGSNGEIILAGGVNNFTETTQNAILHSSDDGATWEVLSDGAGPVTWYDIDEFEGNWLAVGASGATTAFTLADDTLSSGIITGFNIADVSFVNESHGAFVTEERVHGKIFTTTDGGATWENNLTLEGRKDFTAVAYVDNNNIWAIGEDHFTGGSVWLIYHSSDQGSTWNKVEPGVPENEQRSSLEDLQFIDAQIGFIKAEDKLLKTTDGGSAWNAISEPDNISYSDFEMIAFQSEDNGWMAGQETIASTSDGGATWSIQYEEDGFAPEITDIYFFDSSTGYVTKERGDMMKTTDGGENWTELSTLTTFDLNDLHFFSEDSGLVVGEGGRILKTVDGGANFETDYSLTQKDFHAIEFAGNGSGWIVGEKGTIYSTSNRGGIATSNEEPLTGTIPVDVQLHQNYPNPFNPSTNIRYQVPSNSTVSLKVYDMLGREVATLLNTKAQPAGEYEVTFNAGNLSSGMYLYRLQVNQTVVTKKLTLIK
ncbi:YCF48-related protein [Gracilimonas sediminicola]|uniref:YCF48-related protein n=1 Tax=Gracilimonas sediminicola TaxID=2952158 RepID=A0A9X2L2B9_9BACT|nr:YCF48-related protein [Gracilimonas sediminicola]MCP9290914.1 YCF48-related protein [Gracilimonas sediminicola]